MGMFFMLVLAGSGSFLLMLLSISELRGGGKLNKRAAAVEYEVLASVDE